MGQVIDLELFNEAKSIMKSKFPTILEYFIEDAQDYINSIRKGLNENDPAVIASSAHALKSSSRQMGAVRLGDSAAEIESLARDSFEAGPILPFFPKLEQIFKESAVALREM